MKSEIEKIRNGDLYALLALCTKEDLDPLVKIILSKLSNYLDINKDYKRFKPDHTKYHQVIGDEIRLFRGELHQSPSENNSLIRIEKTPHLIEKLGILIEAHHFFGSEPIVNH